MSRECKICGVKMIEGYIHEEKSLYFCSEEHLDKQWKGVVEELRQMSEEEFEDSVLYWTDWSDELTEEELESFYLNLTDKEKRQ